MTTTSAQQTVLLTDDPRRFYLLRTPSMEICEKCDGCEQTIKRGYFQVLAIDSVCDVLFVGYACSENCARKLADEAENVAEETGE